MFILSINRGQSAKKKKKKKQLSQVAEFKLQYQLQLKRKKRRVCRRLARGVTRKLNESKILYAGLSHCLLHCYEFILIQSSLPSWYRKVYVCVHAQWLRHVGIFVTQGSNQCILGFLHCGWLLYLLSHRGNPKRGKHP